jgi:hypothetical protein
MTHAKARRSRRKKVMLMKTPAEPFPAPLSRGARIMNVTEGRPCDAGKSSADARGSVGPSAAQLGVFLQDCLNHDQA